MLSTESADLRPPKCLEDIDGIEKDMFDLGL